VERRNERVEGRIGQLSGLSWRWAGVRCQHVGVERESLTLLHFASLDQWFPKLHCFRTEEGSFNAMRWIRTLERWRAGC
jgi:hypothetical protein